MTTMEFKAKNSIVSVFEQRGIKLTKAGSTFKALCPFHKEETPSLLITPEKQVWFCHGCHIGGDVIRLLAMFDNMKDGDVMKANGISDKVENHAPSKTETSRIVACYDYHDEQGQFLFQVVRKFPKSFPQRHRAANGEWVWNMDGVRKVLYRLPEIIKSMKQGHPVLICEGEKDVESLVERGFSATCNPGGAGKWEDSYSETLRGADVIIIPDNDDPGRKHAELVAGRLAGIARTIRVVSLPKGKDAFAFFAAGGTTEELTSLIDTAPTASEWVDILPVPPLATPTTNAENIRGEIIKVLRNDDLSHVEQRVEIAKAVVSALTKRGQFFYHADLRDFDSAMFFDGKRKRLERIRSDGFIAWLSVWVAVNRADSLFKYIVAEVETAALSGEITKAILPESFWASRPDALYISNGDGRAVKITCNAINDVDNGADGVLFAAGKTLAPWNLVEPHDAFETCAIFRDAHCAAAHGKDLLRLWMYSLPTTPKSKPPLCLAGTIGSGKTRTAKAIDELFGIPFVAQKVEDDSESNFWPSIDQGGVFTLDNADSRCRWLADSLANAATDGCSQRRKLYTNSETVILRARAWLIVTTANPTFASDAGLADRLLLIRMESRDDESRDEALSEEILAHRDSGLSHIAHTLRVALADTTATKERLNHRHPDFAAFAVKIGRALGREAEAITALTAAEMDKSAFCLENDSVGNSLINYLREAKNFSGTASELLPKLVEIDPELKDKLSAKRLGKRLTALFPHLKKSLATAHKEPDRNGINRFQFEIGECGVCGV
jgi:hypothetical protein